MDGFAIFLFILSIALFVAFTVIVLYDQTLVPGPSSTPSSGFPLPDSTMIGAQCPVGCTCFPNTGATTSTDNPTQVCAFLDNDTMFSCPPQCCQPTCINQDVQVIARRVSK